MRFLLAFFVIFGATQLLADTNATFGSWNVATKTYEGNEGTVRSCTLISKPVEILTNPSKKTTLDDMIIGIVKNTFKDKNDAQQFRIQLIQTANSKVQYFDRRSTATLSFSPSSLQLPLNDNLKIGVGAFNFTKSQFSDFSKSFKSANDLILNVDMKGSMKGKLVFSLRGSSKALSFFNKNC